MKTRQIGDVFMHPDYGKLKVVESCGANMCDGCVFVGEEHCMNDAARFHTGHCSIEIRGDGLDVIFVKAEGGEDA